MQLQIEAEICVMRVIHSISTGYELTIFLRVVEEIDLRLAGYNSGVDTLGHVGKAIHGALLLTGCTQFA